MANIFVIDDEMQVIELLNATFKADGHTVRSALDPMSMAVLLSDFKPDVIVLDMNMPAGGSPMALKVIDNDISLHATPLICYSSLPVEKQREMIAPLPNRYYLEKETDISNLKDLVARVSPPTT